MGIVFFFVIVVSIFYFEYVVFLDFCFETQSNCDFNGLFLVIVLLSSIGLVVLLAIINFFRLRCIFPTKTAKFHVGRAIVDAVVWTSYLFHIVIAFWLSRTFITMILSLVITTKRAIQAIVYIITFIAIFSESRNYISLDFEAVKGYLIKNDKLDFVRSWDRFYLLCREVGYHYSVKLAVITVADGAGLLVIITAYYALDLSNRTLDDSISNIFTIFISLILPTLPKITLFLFGNSVLQTVVMEKRLGKALAHFEPEEDVHGDECTLDSREV